MSASLSRTRSLRLPFIAIAIGLATPALYAQTTLRVATLNAWHGLRSDELSVRETETAEQREARFQCQIQELRALAPDIVFLQEVNPIPRQSARYAEALGYDEIHRISACGLRLGPLKFPRSLSEGLTILAKPELGLRELGTTKLSGPGGCWCRRFSLQLGESRYALFGEISLNGRRVLLANTHLHARAYVGEDFESSIRSLAEAGSISGKQRDQIFKAHSKARERNALEAARLLEATDRIERRWAASGASPFEAVLLGGDFNATPDSDVVRSIRSGGFDNLTKASPGAYATLDWQGNDNRHAAKSARYSLPDFGVSDLQELYRKWQDEPHQVDYLFLRSDGIRSADNARIAFDSRCDDGRFPSDHYGLAVDIELPAAEASEP